MEIVIKVPDTPVDRDWLKWQLKKLQVIRWADGYSCIQSYSIPEEAEQDFVSPEAVLYATDEFFDQYGFTLYNRVVFHADGMAYVCPEGDPLYSDSSAWGDADEHYPQNWTKVTWGEGLVALAKGLHKRIRISDVSRLGAVEAAIETFAAAVRDIDLELPIAVQIEVE